MKCNISVLLKAEVIEISLTWLPLFSHWEAQHVRYINLISLKHVALKDSLTKSEGLSCLIEAYLALSLTSIPEQVQL